jgi:23S rRNA G2069 N7-methylase RlmK/C1962 C5-methylase RlmI
MIPSRKPTQSKSRKTFQQTEGYGQRSEVGVRRQESRKRNTEGYTKRHKRGLPKGYVTPDKEKIHAEVLANSVVKKYRHFSKKFAREHIDCYRLYDWDSPDIRVVVDWYAGHLVVAEYEREQTGPDYLPNMAHAVAAALQVSAEKVFIKRRHTNLSDAPRYSKMDSRNERFEVRERNLKLWVNLSDFLDTGLYSDHRDTRQLIKAAAKDKDFLNLFAYTGVVTCAAAAGGARSTTTVDRNETYLKWAHDNLALNGLWDAKRHDIIRADALEFLEKSCRMKKRYSLVFIDPPSFFKDEEAQVSFDINRDHPSMLAKVIEITMPGCDIYFSTNHQRFEPRLTGLAVSKIEKLTPKTIPEDYRNKNVHNCWKITV